MQFNFQRPMSSKIFSYHIYRSAILKRQFIFGILFFSLSSQLNYQIAQIFLHISQLYMEGNTDSAQLCYLPSSQLVPFQEIHCPKHKEKNQPNIQMDQSSSRCYCINEDLCLLFYDYCVSTSFLNDLAYNDWLILLYCYLLLC